MTPKRFLVRLVLGAATAAGAVCIVDYGVFEIRVVSHRNPFGSVVVQHFDAVAKKSGKTEFIFDPPQAQTCVNALLPFGGFAPCWYLRRHTEQATDF